MNINTRVLSRLVREGKIVSALPVSVDDSGTIRRSFAPMGRPVEEGTSEHDNAAPSRIRRGRGRPSNASRQR